ncbi:exonuclease mut-7 homolog [Andrena cerasifolii]|uniref:exonuclease mut-7 homolog n=1 Tax=Andrena cerasifolii TaxID=2819439 RepID=UPI004037E200
MASSDETEQPAFLNTGFSTNDDELLFFTSIDEATKEWLKSLDHIWHLWKKCDGVCQTLRDYFESAPNPYLSTLRILVNTSDFKHVKLTSSLALTVIEEYAKWLETRRDAYRHFLAVDLKLAAFRLMITQNNMQFVKLVAVTYEFTEHKEEFVDIIKQLLREKKYKEAAQYAAMLKLQTYFPDVESLLLPLILQNKLTIVDEFLANCPEMQEALVKYLDRLIAPDNNMHVALDRVIEKHNIPDTKMSTVQTRPMIKLIARFVKLYNFPAEVCPNVNKKRCEGALQFLIHKRYVDGSLSTVSWREMIQEAVGDDRKLQLEMIRMLINARDAKEGLYWAREFDIPKEQWPWAISYELENEESNKINDGASTSRGEMYDWEDAENSVNYHELKLSKDSIKVVSDAQSFSTFLDNGLNDVHIVGIDSEWKPTFGTKQTELALIQIATETNVYILDVTTMGKESEELWAELALTLFDNKHILKLGFGISYDMTLIRDSLPALSKVKTYGQGYLDIVHLWKKLVDDYKFTFPHSDHHVLTKQSLSQLVELCLGHKLDKSDQFSNWKQRPLRESQIIYAALDAYCLLEVYNVIEKQCHRLSIPFYDICAEIQHIPQKLPKKNTRNQNKPQTFGNGPSNFDKQQNSFGFIWNRPPPKFRGVQPPRYPRRQEFGPRPMHPYNGNNPVRFINPHNPRMKYPNMQHHESRIQVRQPQMLDGKIIPAHKWRVVCDSMLGALVNKLRMCGCDCVHTVFDQGGSRCIKLAIQENRILLTGNKEYLKVAQFSQPPGNSYLVSSENSDEQLKEVLNHFGILVTQRDIFSRCQACNGDEFAKVTKKVMDDLVESFAKMTRDMDYSNSSPANSINNDSTHDNCVNDYVPNEDRTWILSTNSVIVDTCATKYQTRIQVDKVPVKSLTHVQIFYICERCGKIYWDGSRVERTFNGVLRDLIVRA